MAAASELKVTTPSDLEIQMTREFDAPRERVYGALTDCSSYPRWWGPRKYTTVVDQCDMRVGGKWRFLSRAEGEEHAFRGEFRELVRPEKVVWTFEWEGMPGHIAVETMTLDDIGSGRSRLTASSLWDNKEDRDGMLQSGMEEGARETYERLDELLASLKKP